VRATFLPLDSLDATFGALTAATARLYRYLHVLCFGLMVWASSFGEGHRQAQEYGSAVHHGCRSGRHGVYGNFRFRSTLSDFFVGGLPSTHTITIYGKVS